MRNAKTYNQFEKVRNNYEKQINELKNKNDALTDENEKLRKRISDNYDAASKGEVALLKSKNLKLERQNKELENQNKSKNSYTCFPNDIQQLFSKIFKLKNSNANNIDKLIYKFKRGSDDILPLIKKAYHGEKITMYDAFTYTFRDNLISIFEKVLQVVTEKPYARLPAILNNARKNKKEYRATVKKNYPNIGEQYADVELLDSLLMLYQLENTAYHGKYDTMKFESMNKNKKQSMSDSQMASKAFLDLPSKQQYKTMISLLKFLYEVFSNKNSEILLLHVLMCWNI